MSSYSHTKPVLDTYQALVSTFSEFLTVAVHTILYERNIYPRTSFLKARKYNYPVRQNRHPKVCKWIQDAVTAVEVEMLKVSYYILSIHGQLAALMWLHFSMSRVHQIQVGTIPQSSSHTDPFLPDSTRFDLPAITRVESVPGEGW